MDEKCVFDASLRFVCDVLDWVTAITLAVVVGFSIYCLVV